MEEDQLWNESYELINDNPLFILQSLSFSENEHEVSEILECSGGNLCHVFEIVISTKNEEDTSVILKIFPPKKNQKETNYLKEKAIYEWIKDIDDSFPVPKIFAAMRTESANNLLQRDFILMEKIPGSNLVNMELSNCCPKEIWTSLGALLHRLHQLSTNRELSYGVITGKDQNNKLIVNPSFPTNGEFMRFLISTKLNVFNTECTDSNLNSEINNLIKNFSYLFYESNQPCLCHNDFHQGNVIVEGNVIKGIIDFELSLIGDPLFDLAKLIVIATRRDSNRKSLLIDGYFGGLLSLSNKEEARIELYKVYHSLDLWYYHFTNGNKQHLRGIEHSMRETVQIASYCLNKLY